MDQLVEHFCRRSHSEHLLEPVPPAVRMSGVSKAFRSHLPSGALTEQVLDSIEFTLPAGQVLAILGRNGAGKTTLLKILASLIIADKGNIEIFGMPVHSGQARRFIGFASGDERSLYFRLTGRENLRFFADLYGLSRTERERRIDLLAGLFDLVSFIDRRVDRCSSGMRARLGLSRAMLHSPRLLLLDEPTKNLDPAHAVTVRQILSKWSGPRTAVILTTHLPQDVEQMATRVGILREGHFESCSVEASEWPQRLQDVSGNETPDNPEA